MDRRELSGQELDKIIDEILTTSRYEWSKLASHVGLAHQVIRSMLWSWNLQKIRFAKIPSNTPYKDSAIIKIVGGFHAEKAGIGIASLSTQEGVHCLLNQQSYLVHYIPEKLSNA
jgi:hypothetical protein